MGIFSSPFRTPGYGGDQADAYQLDAPEIIQRIAKPKARYDDLGGTHDKLRSLAASLIAAGGNDQGAAAIRDILQQRNMDSIRQQQLEQEQAYRDAQIAHMNAPSPVNLGNGGFGTYSPTGGFNVLREPMQPEQSSYQERLYNQWKSLPDNDPNKAMLARMLPNYQYTAPVMQAQQQNRERLKQLPTYGNLHPRAPTRAAPKPPAGFILD